MGSYWGEIKELQPLANYGLHRSERFRQEFIRNYFGLVSRECVTERVSPGDADFRIHVNNRDP